jgi:hypothetical protein
MSSAIHEKKEYQFLKNEEKMAKKHDFWEQKKRQRQKNQVF